MALPHGSHYCQPAAEHWGVIRTHGRSPCVHQTSHLLKGRHKASIKKLTLICQQYLHIIRFDNQNITTGLNRLWICVFLVCVLQGSHVYLERSGDLKLLLAEKDQAQGTVHCFSLSEGALFVEAVPQTDISRRITAFQYELVPSQGPGADMYPYLHPGLGKWMHVSILFPNQLSFCTNLRICRIILVVLIIVYITTGCCSDWPRLYLFGL